jgi:hypothetical protein
MTTFTLHGTVRPSQHVRPRTSSRLPEPAAPAPVLTEPAARSTNMRWYPLLRRIAREVEWTGARPATMSELDLLTRRLYAAYFHGHADPKAWPPRTDRGTLCPESAPDGDFVSRIHAEFGGRHRLRTRLLGYLTVFGAQQADGPEQPTLRCYLNLIPDAAPAVFAAVVRRLEAEGIPYAGKLLDNPANFGRPDAAVFYATRADASALVSSVRGAYDADAFGATVPAFTREVAPGIAVADDPGDGMSFGFHRCGLIAAGIAAAGAGDPHARLGAIIDAFLRAGIDPARPHLGPRLPELVLDGAAA